MPPLVGKPAFCDLSLLREPQADAVHQQMRASGLPVMMANADRCGPGRAAVTAPAAALHGADAFAPRRAQACGICRAAAAPKGGDRLLGSEVMLDMLQLASSLFREPPTCIWTVEAAHSPLLSLLLEFGPDRVAQLNLWIDPTSPPICRVRAVAEHGQAEVVLPRRLQWRDSEGEHRQQWRRHPLRQTLLQRFALTVQGGQPMQPSFEETYQALLWWRAALRSQAEKQRVVLSPEAVLET